MLSFEDIRDIVSGKAPDSLVRQVRIPDPLPPHGLGLEYDAVAYAVAKGYYPVDILDPEVAKRYQASMDSEEREPFLSKRIETYESRESISSERAWSYLDRNTIGGDLRTSLDPFNMKLLDEIPDDYHLTRAIPLFEKLRSMGISLQNGYVINIHSWSRTCKIHNTKNGKLVTWIINKKAKYRIRGEEKEPEVDGIPPISPWRNIMKGRYAGEIDAKGLPYLAMLVLRAAVIKYPNLIKRVNNPASIQDAIDLSNLVYRGELPEPQDYGWAGEGLRDYRIPIDCLPVPPKDVILKLSDAWSYYVSAWNILGGYGIEGLKYDHSHLELAYRNGKYTPDLKVNHYTSRSVNPVPEKYLFETLKFSSVYEMNFDNHHSSRQEYYSKVWYFRKSLKDVFKSQRCPVTWRYIQSIFEDKEEILPQRPWHHIVYSSKQMLEEAEWIKE